MDNRAIGDMIAYYRSEPWVAHTLKVLGYAQGIAAGEGLEGAEREALEYAALFHDVGIPEGLRTEGSAAGPVQERLGAPIARRLAAPYVSSREVLERVEYLVGHHHSLEIRGQCDLQVLFEADFLVNFYEDALGPDAIRSALDKIFRTKSGKLLCQITYFPEE